MEDRRRVIAGLLRQFPQAAFPARARDPRPGRADPEPPRLAPEQVAGRPQPAAGVRGPERVPRAGERFQQAADLHHEVRGNGVGAPAGRSSTGTHPAASRAAIRRSTRWRAASAAARPRVTRRSAPGSRIAQVSRAPATAAI